MARKPKAPVVVAELGRPETARETSARKAENSRLYRERKTVNNLVFSLLVSVALMLVIFFMSPQSKGGFEDRSVDVTALASESSPSAGRTLAAPAVPEGWKAKQATLRESDGVTAWRINYTTADEAYAVVIQAFTADGSPVDEDWIEAQFEGQGATGGDRMGDVEWTIYDHSDRDPDSANMLFGLRSTIGTDALLVYGTDTEGTLRVLATEAAASLEPDSATSSATDSGAGS